MRVCQFRYSRMGNLRVRNIYYYKKIKMSTPPNEKLSKKFGKF